MAAPLKEDVTTSPVLGMAWHGMGWICGLDLFKTPISPTP